jgi:hypothetical protein
MGRKRECGHQKRKPKPPNAHRLAMDGVSTLSEMLNTREGYELAGEVTKWLIVLHVERNALRAELEEQKAARKRACSSQRQKP